jgi:glutathione S-transferase
MLLASPAIILTAAVSLLAVILALLFALAAGRTRSRLRIDAPAMSGHPELERALRIQGNTVEQLVIFLPALWLAALYFQGWWAPLLGLVWCAGRIVYAFTYGDYRARFPGFALTVLPTVILMVLAALGLFGAWTASAA